MLVPPKHIVKLSESDVDLARTLKTRHRDILLATRELEIVTYKSLAEHFGVPQGTIKSRLSRARASLHILKHHLDTAYMPTS